MGLKCSDYACGDGTQGFAFASEDSLEIRNMNSIPHPSLIPSAVEASPALPSAQRSRHASLHQLFEAQVDRSPGAVAVQCGAELLSYQALDDRANQLARQLIASGLPLEPRIGLFVSRSVSAVVGYLAVLKAGGCVVAIEPNYPAGRVRTMIADAKLTLMLTDLESVPRLPAGGPPQVVVDGAAAAAIAAQPSARLDLTDGPPNALAYLTYTSGSTGEPRAVMVSHANVTAFLQGLQASLGFTSSEVLLHLAPLAFSASVRQLMLPLISGAAVVVARPAEIASPRELFALIKRAKVTTVHMVPSYWRACVDVLRSLEVDVRRELLDNSLKTVMSASEPLWSSVPREFAALLPRPVSMFNLFGHTESSGVICIQPVDPSTGAVNRVLPIGRAIGAAQVHILDESLNPTLDGHPGEIFVGGPTVAQGYLNQPELSAERFVKDPFSMAPSARLFRSGDRGRRLPDGTIEFLGRLDHQVKIRGQRVELGEVETVLRQHPSVRDAAVVVFPDGADLRMVGFVVPDRQRSPVVLSDLKEFLTARLPAYMVPSALMTLDALPLNTNGKVDRGALQAPAAAPLEEETYAAPRTRVEEILVEMWAEALGVERVGVNDNFFELGGHSLLATKLLSQLEQVVPTEGSLLMDFFAEPTVAGLAHTIAEGGLSEDEAVAKLLISRAT